MLLGGLYFVVQNNWEYNVVQGCASRAVVAMTVSPTQLSLCTNGLSALMSTTTDQLGNNWVYNTTSWTSSNPSAVPVGVYSARQANVSSGNVEGGQATITASMDDGSATANVTVVYCPPAMNPGGGPYSLNLYQSGRFTAYAYQGISPYTYEFQKQNCTVSGSCGAWGAWVSTGANNYWDTVVYGCNIEHIYVRSRATDSRGNLSFPSDPWVTYINNPC